jgi:hypothetical protein
VTSASEVDGVVAEVPGELVLGALLPLGVADEVFLGELVAGAVLGGVLAGGAAADVVKTGCGETLEPFRVMSELPLL